MSKLIWDKTGERYYETGVDRGVHYAMKDGAYPVGVAWNGLTAVNESPSGAEPSPLYADNIKYLNLMSAEEFGATIEAYTYPDEFAECDGSAEIAAGVSIGQQTRKMFGLSYRTKLGNDTIGSDYAYIIHLIYGALASPSEKSYETINDSPDAITFSWELSTTPVEVPGFKPTASVTIKSNKVKADALAKLEAILYGTDHELLAEQPDDWSTNYKNYYIKSRDEYVAVTGDSAPSWEAGKYYTGATDPRLPLPAELITIIGE